ncbi:MAG: radical SAM protein [Euryarchaeota archaeon]|nr:radical SAM protein [Euryarchaeota archaeon]
MRLLLVHPGFPYKGKDLFPLGLGYLAGSCEDLAEIRVVDEAAGRFSPRILEEFSPDVVGITATTPSFPRAVEIIREVRSLSPGTRIIVGGTHASFLPGEALSAGAHAVVRGEGEETLRDILGGIDLAEIPGVSYMRDGRVCHNPDRPPIADLDSIPFPAHRYFPLEKYRIMSVVTSRGCPYSCSYCSAARFWGNRVRYRSPENVIEELKAVQELGFKLVKFQDSTFTSSRHRAMAICEAMVSEGLDLRWSCETRADHLTDDLVEAMAGAGCILLCIGVDSGSQAVLDNIGRRMKPEAIVRAFELARKHGIRTRAYVTFGMPGETRTTVGETLALLERIRPDQTLLSLATQYPGTELWGGPSVKAPPQWVRSFGGHGDGSPLYLSDTLDRSEYMELAEALRDGIKDMQGSRPALLRKL